MKKKPVQKKPGVTKMTDETTTTTPPPPTPSAPPTSQPPVDPSAPTPTPPPTGEEPAKTDEKASVAPTEVMNITDRFTLTSDAPTDGTPVAPGTVVNLTASADSDFSIDDHSRGALTPDPNLPTKATYMPYGVGEQTITATSRSASRDSDSISIVSNVSS